MTSCHFRSWKQVLTFVAKLEAILGPSRRHGVVDVDSQFVGLFLCHSYSQCVCWQSWTRYRSKHYASSISFDCFYVKSALLVSGRKFLFELNELINTNRNIKRFGVLPIRIVQSNVSSVGPSLERKTRVSKQTLQSRRSLHHYFTWICIEYTRVR